MRLQYMLALLILALSAESYAELGHAKIDHLETLVPTLEVNNGQYHIIQHGNVEIIFSNHYCDVCSPEDKEFLERHSHLRKRVVQLIGMAHKSIELSTFALSITEVYEALLEAIKRGVVVRVAHDYKEGTNGKVLEKFPLPKGGELKLIKGTGATGLLHSKFMIIDGDIIVLGSNNLSVQGTSINNEHTIVVWRNETYDPLPEATVENLFNRFQCHFEDIWDDAPARQSLGEYGGSRCSDFKQLVFMPDVRARKFVMEHVSTSNSTILVLCHHLMDAYVIQGLYDALTRGADVRVIYNSNLKKEWTDRVEEILGKAKAQKLLDCTRYKKVNSRLGQKMHNKLMIIDGKKMVEGSGNFSNNAFTHNFEFLIVWRELFMVNAFVTEFERLWKVSVLQGEI